MRRKWNEYVWNSVTVSLAVLLAVGGCAVTDNPSHADRASVQAGSLSGSLPRRPNIIVLLADDLGYGGLRVQGDTEVMTPHIDSIAAGGVRLTSFYANHPVCAPSRAGLMTGIYPHRMGFEYNPAGAGPNFGLPLDVPTLPERLKTQGYATALFGKWHLGYRPEIQPTSRGFDTFFGFLGGTHPYAPAGITNLSATDGEDARTSKLMRGTVVAPMPAHLTEALGDEALAFIKANRDRPFFLFLSFNAPHVPMQTTRPYYDRFAHIRDQNRRIHLAMMAAMDDQVGRVLATLEAEGLEEDTLVIFASDNGGPTHQTTSSNGPLNGEKALLLEGGIRVPAMVKWKGRLPIGRVIETPAIGLDITATALAAAGALPPRGMDGVDLMPWLAGKTTAPIHDALYWRAGAQGAVRQGDWKLVKNGDLWHLFNLAGDIGERNDLASRNPQRLMEMKLAWTSWSAQMKPPSWVPGRKSDIAKQESYSRDIENAIKGIVEKRSTPQ